MSAEARAARVRWLLMDVDGVLTDGRLHYGPQGEALKVFDVRDGLGVKLLQAAGIGTALLTARRSEAVALRARELGIDRVMQGLADKAGGFASFLRETGAEALDCGYIGDDWPDLPVLRRVGLAAAVADARPQVRAAAHWVSSRPGGAGAVRELAEFILRAQGRFEAVLRMHGGDAPPDGTA
jgi:3-deoxy-D-manno-octulosonate 8-phosphate phosphatase (KDO 8-P phosphatase)